MGSRRRASLALLIALAAMLVVTAATAASKDPLKLVLQRSDVPGAMIVEIGRGPAPIDEP
jgi:hypothetical protein